MKRTVFAVLLLAGLSASAVQAADYTVDLAHSQVGFSIRHLVANTRGQFTDYKATIAYDPAKVEASKVKAEIQTKSIDTRNPDRDKHLRSADFFNVEKFPTITFDSTSVKRTAPNKLSVAGNFTMLGVTKPVTLEVEEGGIAKDPWGNTKAGFLATLKINRKDYGMVWNKALDSGSLILGDEVTINLEIEAQQVVAVPANQPMIKAKK